MRGGFLPALFLEENVVAGVGVERRVEVDQVHAGVRDVLAQDFEVVAEIEHVLFGHLWERITQCDNRNATGAKARSGSI